MEEKNFILEFIEVYRNLLVLWQVKSKSYSNRIEKRSSTSIKKNFKLRKEICGPKNKLSAYCV